MNKQGNSADIRSNTVLNENKVVGQSKPDEQLIWNRFIQGDDQSLVYIYSNYADTLYRYGRQFSKRPEFIQDCIQEMFFDLIKKRASLSQAQSIKGYLFSTLKRRILRDIKKEEKLVLEEEGFSISLSEQSTSISNTIDQKDLSIIEEKLNLLSAHQREAILLHFFEGLTYTEIADIMNIKVRSARVLTYRALDALHEQLKPYKENLYFVLLAILASR
ncbi:MAG: sigma-70 family RNA polymerase sigma factor [Cyclobacteriaceae bacterium]